MQQMMGWHCTQWTSLQAAGARQRASNSQELPSVSMSTLLSACRAHAADDGLALHTMDIFAGCGGLSEGFQQAGAAVCKWAIEYEHPAAEAFKLNHPAAHVMCNNCNVILAAAMHKAGLEDLCKASPEVCSRQQTWWSML